MKLFFEQFFTDLKSGAVIGCAVIIWMLIEYVLGFHSSRIYIGEWSGYGAWAVFLIALWIALRAKRKQFADRALTWIRGAFFGVVVSLPAALLIASFLFLYHLFINPSWTERNILHREEVMRQRGATEEEIAVWSANAWRFSRLSVQMPLLVGGIWLGGIAAGTCLGLLLRSKAPEDVDLSGIATRI